MCLCARNSECVKKSALVVTDLVTCYHTTCLKVQFTLLDASRNADCRDFSGNTLK